MQVIAPFLVKKGNRITPVAVFIVTASILAVLLSQTAFAQNTYVITDGDQVTVHTSYAEDPEQVLSEAGIRLDEDDFFTTLATDGGSEITLSRSQTITVDYCGQQLQLNSYGESLESLLARSGLYYAGDYQVSLPLNTKTADGLSVTVERVVHQEETYTQSIPHDVVYCYDETLPRGQEEVLVAGVPGQMLCTADVTYRNNVEQQRLVLESSVQQEPVTEVIAMGTGENAGSDRTQPLIGGGVIVLPSGEILTYNRQETFEATAYTHTDDGCDMITATGTTVRRGTVAIDPTVVPYGTRMFIVSNDGSYVYGIATAEDCGSGVQGNRVDLYYETTEQCLQFGRRDCTVYFLGDANWN